MPTRRPSRAGPADTRERLLRAAADAFNRDGYLGTDSNRIAHEAGFAAATFYKHFADKRAALLAVHERWVAGEWDGVADELARPATAREAARRLVQHLATAQQRWSGVQASLQILSRTDAVAREALRAQRGRVLDLLQRMRGGRGASGRRERDALVVFAVERACDALADGEARELRLTQARLTQELERLVEEALASS